MKFLDLAERVEKLGGHDPELDELVAIALGYERLPDAYGESAGHWVSPYYLKRKACWESWVSHPDCPAFTGSMDKAMSAVPSGYLWTMDSWDSGWSAGIWRGSRWVVHCSKSRQQNSPELALLAASLRAHSVLSQ